MKAVLIAALGMSFACASTTSSGAPSAEARGCAPATAPSGAVVYSNPDSNSKPVASLAEHARVCADADSVGFGFRHVKLSDGKEGFVAESDLI